MKMMLYYSLTISTCNISTLNLLWREENRQPPCLDVLIDNSYPESHVTSVYRKKAYTDYLLIFSAARPILCNLVLFAH